MIAIRWCDGAARRERWTLWHFTRDGWRTLCGRGEAPRRNVARTLDEVVRPCFHCAHIASLQEPRP
jgi:hypothetical protein